MADRLATAPRLSEPMQVSKGPPRFLRAALLMVSLRAFWGSVAPDSFALARGLRSEQGGTRVARGAEEEVSGESETMKAFKLRAAQYLPGRDTPLPVSDKHYVLKNPMKGPWPAGFKVLVFANGCFWGSEKGAWRLPGGGIYSTAVGYAGGTTRNPTYEEVCSKRTGHTEAVQVVYDPEKISAVDILRWFWESHDPTQGNGQGNDRGPQYRSALYYFDDEQRQLFESSKNAYEAALRAKGRGMGPEITTEIRAASDFPDSKVFYYAEDFHQQYLAKPRARPYCSAQPQVVALPPFEQWAPAALHQKYAPKLSEEFWQTHGPTPHCVIRSPNEPIVWP